MKYDHPLDEIVEENIELPQPQVSLVERLMPVDPSVYDKSIDPNLISDMKLNRPQNWDDPTWKYAAYAPEEQKDTKTLPVRCLLCGFLSRGGIHRVKLHITRVNPVGGKLGTRHCPKASSQIRAEILKVLMEKIPSRKSPIVDFERLPMDFVKRNVVISGVGSSSSGNKEIKSCGKIKIVGPLGLKEGETLLDVVKKRKTDEKRQTTIADHIKIQEKKIVDQYGAKFFITSGVAFNVANNMELQAWVEGIGRYGPGYMIPSPDLISGPLLEEEVLNIHELQKKHENQWAKGGCTLMSDGWTDRRGRTIINFLANSKLGSFYLGSTDCTTETKTGEFIAEGLSEMIEKIGKEKVVQLCTDNASNSVIAGNILMSKYPHLFWTPCAAHVLDLVLEDIERLPTYKDTFKHGKKITSFIHSITTLHAEWLKVHGKELVRCGVTRFATSFLTLQSINEAKENLRTFNWSQWARGNHNCLDVADIVVNTRFWFGVEDVLKASEPILRVLRIVDGDTKPNMAYLHGAFLAAKKAIIDNFGGVESSYRPILKILDKRWEKHFKSSIVKAAFFLNPLFYYKIENDPQTLVECNDYEEAFADVLDKIIVDDIQLKMKVLADMCLYKSRSGRFGTTEADVMAATLEPSEWWGLFANKTPELKKIAMRILCLCCSASSCERKWSIFTHFHTKSQNRLGVVRQDNLIYTKFNMKMDERFKINKLLIESGSKKYDAICVDEFNHHSEWVTGIPGACNEFVYTEDGLTWADVEETVGATDHLWSSTRSRQSRPITKPKDEDESEKNPKPEPAPPMIYKRKRAKKI